jgi:sec-independent protein translocase protein TatC
MVETKGRKANPEGKMPLKAHLVELRNRIFKSLLGLAVGMVGGFFLYYPVFDLLTKPIRDVNGVDGRMASITFTTVGQPFDQLVQVSVFIGVVISSPVWLYQLWAFIMPGLKKREKWTALGFIGAAVPLFIGGVGLALFVLPHAVQFFTSINPQGTANLITASDYLSFVIRLLLAFGLAMIIPVLLFGLNMMGLIKGRQILKSWRVTLFVICLVAAMAAPGSDAMTMVYLAAPLLLLFAIATALCAATASAPAPKPTSMRPRTCRAGSKTWADLRPDAAGHAGYRGSVLRWGL